MSDFRTTLPFIKCDDLKINGQEWPSQYGIDNAYLKFTFGNGLEWEQSSAGVNNEDGGLNDYLIMNQVKGGSGINIAPTTNSYLRAGPGQRTGGPDGKGTGLTYPERGQITVGLREEDHETDAAEIGIHGSSLTRHASLTNRELSFISEREKINYYSPGEKYFKESSINFKISEGDIFKKESNIWINDDYKSKAISNKILLNPLISGDTYISKDKNNSIFGPDAGNLGVLSQEKHLEGTFRHNKILEDSFSNDENYYKDWTIETITSDNKKEAFVVEEYTVGYQKIYGKLDDYNSPIDNSESSFTYNNYYEGWNLSVPAYTIYKSSSSSSHLIRPSTVFKIEKDGNIFYETLTRVCKSTDNILFFENSHENYNDYNISIAGIPDNTTVTSVTGNQITISNETDAFIPAKTNITFTNSSEVFVISEDVEKGVNTINLTEPPPSTSETLNVFIKEFNTGTITLTKENYSEKFVDYTIKPSSIIPSGTTITENLTTSSTSITLSQSTTGILKQGISLFVGSSVLKVLSDVSEGSTVINISSGHGCQENTGVNVYQRSFEAETIISSDDFRVMDKTKNNICKTLYKQEEGTLFYISTQNKKHEKGTIYGERIGKMLSEKKLNVYHRETEGFYNGWFVYFWNSKITLDKNITYKIQPGTVVTFTNPIDSNIHFDIALDIVSETSNLNYITIPTSSIPEYSIDGYSVNIKGFPSDTTVSSHDSTTHAIINLSSAIQSGGALPDGTLLKFQKTDSQTYYFTAGSYTSSGSSHQVTLSPSPESSLDLSGYTVSIYGLADDTKVILPNGIIEGYNSITNEIQTVTNSPGFTIDNTTYYCIKKEYKEVSGSGEKIFVSLDGNKLLKDGYYNNFKIEVEGENNNGYKNNSTDYVIKDYSKEKLITSYINNDNITGVGLDDGSRINGLPSGLDIVQANYYKGWRIVVSPDTDVSASSTLFNGVIKSHGASTYDTSSIPVGTMITDEGNNVDETKRILTITPELNSVLSNNTIIVVSKDDGTSERVTVDSSTTTEITLTTIPSSSFIGGFIYQLTNIDNLVVDWEGPLPGSDDINFYITYNNSQWNDTNKRTLIYKTLTAKHIQEDSNNDNVNRLHGFFELLSHSDGITTGFTDRIELYSNFDTDIFTDNDNVKETDFSPPSTIDNYYNGWTITLHVDNDVETRNIIKYYGDDNIAILDNTILKNTMYPKSVSSYILTKNLDHGKLYEDIIRINSYVTAYNTNNKTVTLSHNLKKQTIDNFKTLTFTPPKVFRKNTTINSIISNTENQYITISINTDMDLLLKQNTEIVITNKENSYKTTLYADAEHYNTLIVNYTSDINSIITSNTKDEYTIDVYGEKITRSIESIDSINTNTITITSNIHYNLIGWYVYFSNDKRYKIYYDKFNATGTDINSLANNNLVNINDFYKNWTLQTEEFFDFRDEVTDSSGQRVNHGKSNFTKRTTVNIDAYDGITNRTTSVNNTYTAEPITDDGIEVKYNFYLLPCKCVKYGDNISNPVTNTMKYHLISGYYDDKNKMIENGTMQGENVLSYLANEENGYYNGWEMTVISTITDNNNKIIFNYNDDEYVTTLTNKSYNGEELASEFQTKLNSVVSNNPFTVSFDSSTNKLTVNSSSTFSFLWDKTYKNYFTKTHKTLGFDKTDDTNYAGNTITSTKDIELYINENMESSLIESYDGTNKTVILNGIRSRNSSSSIHTKTNNRTKYILTPPNHTSGKLTVKSSNEIIIDKDYSVGSDDFYNGWEILTRTNGLFQSSYITDYKKETNVITAPSLDISKLSSENTSYSIINQKHLNGYLRKNNITIFPSEERRGVIQVLDDSFRRYSYSLGGSDTDPTLITLKIYGSDYRWNLLPQPSDTIDYYNDWNISVFVNNYEYYGKVKKYSGIITETIEGVTTTVENESYLITISGINETIFLENEDIDEIVFRYILYEPTYYMLSFGAVPVDNYYDGWTINITRDNQNYTTMIKGYSGKDRRINSDNLPNHLDETYRYELFQEKESIMMGENKLLNNSSPIINYYVGWTLSTIDSNGDIESTSTITSYNAYDKSVTLDPAITGTSSSTKYKLYFNSENTVFGNSTGKNIRTGSRNIAIGSHAGPTITNNSVSDKLYIDANTKSRGSDSFIYGNMSRGSEELKVNADLTVSGNITGGSINNTKIGATSHTTGKFTDVIITSSLEVQGTTTTIDTTSLIIEDPLLLLAKDNSFGDNMDIGFYGMYKDGTPKYTGLFRDSSDKKWKLFKGLNTPPENTTIGSNYEIGTIVANFEGNLTYNTLNDGTTPLTSTVQELNYVHGVTAPIQTQLNSKQSIDSNGNMTISGDLTILGDNLTMVTNTDTAILVANGTNFNPVVPSGDISLTNVGVFSITNEAVTYSKIQKVSGANKLLGSTTADGIVSEVSIINDMITNGTIDLTSKVTGVLPIANGGTGAATLDNLITLGTHTTGNYVATISSSRHITVTNSGSENAAVELSISANAVGLTEMDEIDRGSLITGDLDNNPSYLLIGDANRVLTSNGTDASWTQVTNDMLSGSIENVKLVHDSITVGTTEIKLGQSSNTISGLTDVTVDGSSGLKVKNGNTGAGFIDFYENSTNGTNKIKLKGQESTEDITVILPTTAGTLISTGDTGQITPSMLQNSITSGQVLKSTGTGVQWANESVALITNITNFSDNRLVTASGTSSLNGEEDLTWDGSELSVSGNITMKGAGVNETTNLSGTIQITGTPPTWKMKVIKGGSSYYSSASLVDSNLQITTDGYGLAETPTQDSYWNLLIGAGIGTSSSTSYGISNVLLGYNVCYGQQNLGNYNVFIGHRGGINIDGGVFNIGIGGNSLNNLTTGGYNIAMGHNSGYKIAGGTEDQSSYNVYLGKSSGYETTTGYQNVALGYYSGYALTTGRNNVSIGIGAGPTSNEATQDYKLYIDTKGTSTSFAGTNSLIYGDQDPTNQTLSFNAAVTISNENSLGTLEVQGGEIKFWGREKINNIGGHIWTISSPSVSNISGDDEDSNLVINNKGGFTSLTTGGNAHSNIAIGASSGDYALTSGQRNLFLGNNAGKNLTSASRCIFIGAEAGINFTTISDNICIGDEAGKSAVHTNSSSITYEGNGNIFFGVKAGLHHVGSHNIAIGYTAGSGEASDWASETFNNYNISIGSFALSNFTGSATAGHGFNNAIGGNAMRYIKDGKSNVALGYFALSSTSTATETNAQYNTSIGHYSMSAVTTGQHNVSLGAYSGYDIKEGDNNIILGAYGGRYIASDAQGSGGNNNICIGYASGPLYNGNRINDSNKLYIDTLGGYKEDNSLIYGDQSGSTRSLSFNAIVTIKDTSSTTTGGEIRLNDGDSSHYVGWKAPASGQTNSYTALMPDYKPTNYIASLMWNGSTTSYWVEAPRTVQIGVITAYPSQQILQSVTSSLSLIQEFNGSIGYVAAMVPHGYNRVWVQGSIYGWGASNNQLYVQVQMSAYTSFATGYWWSLGPYSGTSYEMYVGSVGAAYNSAATGGPNVVYRTPDIQVQPGSTYYFRPRVRSNGVSLYIGHGGQYSSSTTSTFQPIQFNVYANRA